MRLSLCFALICGAVSSMAQSAAHFHHVHLNSTDPAAATRFYAARLESESRGFDGKDAIWANRSWLLFNKMAASPKSEITSAIWHIGWGGGADMEETYRRQVEAGVRFQTPLTDLSDQCDGKGGNGRFLFAYIDGPDHVLIELNTTAAGNYRFGHVHLLSEDPELAAEWYVKHFGLTWRGSARPSKEVRYRCGRQTAPAASLMMDDVNIIIYPVGNAKAAFPEAWRNRTQLESSEGHAVDHLGFSVDNLDSAVSRLQGYGVKVLSKPAYLPGTMRRSAFIEGPDRIRIELLEDGAMR